MGYRAHAVTLAGMNREIKSDFKSLSSLDKLVLVKAKEDTMIQPKESEWFGYFKDGQRKDLWTMEEAPWFKENWFGLKDLHTEGKIAFEESSGDHLRFSKAEFRSIINNYLVERTAHPL